MSSERKPLLETLEFREVDRNSWSDLERLFESRGGPKYCWCMVWRRMPRGAFRSDSGAKKEALKHLVEEGAAVGIIGYKDSEPNVWVSIAPRDTYRELGGSRYPLKESDRVWSVVCFFAPRRLRGHGIMRQMIHAAVDHARKNGATMLEAYPVEKCSPSYRFMGFVSSFESHGFQKVGEAGTRRNVMRLRL